MSDNEEENQLLCTQLAGKIACIHRCIARTVEALHEQPAEIDLHKLENLKEVNFLRKHLLQELNHLRFILSRI